MAAANHRTGGSERSNSVSDTPRTDAMDSLRYRSDALFELSRQLERELAAVTAERDRLRDTKWEGITKLESDLAASQQEARRLREALEKYRDALSDGPENCPFSKYEQVDEIARESLASTPAPVHKDTESEPPHWRKCLGVTL